MNLDERLREGLNTLVFCECCGVIRSEEDIEAEISSIKQALLECLPEEKDTPAHKLVETIRYENGFIAEGVVRGWNACLAEIKRRIGE